VLYHTLGLHVTTCLIITLVPCNLQHLILTFASLTFFLSDHSADSDLGRKPGVSAQNQVLNFKKEKGHFHENSVAESNVSEASTESKQTSVNSTDTEITQVKGSLPEGFFDNKEADLRARGIKLVKPDVK